jgi:hypothetical protein
MTINKLVEQFLAERPRNEDIAKYFAIAANIGFNEAIDIACSLVEECSVPDSYSQPTVDDLASDIASLKREV